MDITKYKPFLFDTIHTVFRADSPTGYIAEVDKAVCGILDQLGYPVEHTEKGGIMVTVDGQDNSRSLALLAHVDTLGAMVRSITDDGELKFTVVGSPSIPTLDGEYCRIRTRDGKTYTGTFLSASPAIHVFPDAGTRPRDEENMIVRIDEEVHSKEDVQKLGICPGDYLFFEPRTTITDSGFLKSRFIDDKGSASCLLTILKILKEEGLKPRYRTRFFFSVYEECGHGASYLPDDVREVIAVDMGCIGLDLSCTEYDVSICAKDSGGPYDYGMTSELVRLAKENGLNYAVDIYPRYHSDVYAALCGGGNVKGALFGPGVHASHGMERTHYTGLENTIRLGLLYMGCDK